MKNLSAAGMPQSGKRTPSSIWAISASGNEGFRSPDVSTERSPSSWENNDRYDSKEYLKYFSQVAGIVEMKDFALSHVPLHESQLKKWHFNVHGHLHSRTVKRLRHRDEPKALKRVDDMRFLCVSCEQVNLTPVSYDWILGKLADRR